MSSIRNPIGNSSPTFGFALVSWVSLIMMCVVCDLLDYVMQSSFFELRGIIVVGGVFFGKFSL